MTHRIGLAVLVSALFCQLSPPVHASDTNLGLHRIGAAVARAKWTIDASFPGEKIIFEADHVFGRNATGSAEPGVLEERLKGVLNSHLQWGTGETSLEHYEIRLAPIVRQTTYEIETGSLQPARDFREWGAIRVNEDDPLGLDFYAEISILRLGRAWQKRLSNRPITYTIDLHTSAGWAWASSFDERYAKVSNPYSGVWSTLALEHDRWGQLYLSDRLITGTSLGSPKESMSREALIRFGYSRRIAGCFGLDFFIEKRSFNFSDEVLPSLYTKGKRYGVRVDCRFDKD